MDADARRSAGTAVDPPASTTFAAGLRPGDRVAFTDRGGAYRVGTVVHVDQPPLPVRALPTAWHPDRFVAVATADGFTHQVEVDEVRGLHHQP